MPPSRWTLRANLRDPRWPPEVLGGPPLPFGERVEVVPADELRGAVSRVAELEADLKAMTVARDNWKDEANEAIELLRRWVDEGAAMGGGPRSALTQDTLDLLRDDTADIPDHFMRGEDGYARQMAWEAGNRG